MATAAASRRGRFPVGRRGAENGELFVDGAAWHSGQVIFFRAARTIVSKRCLHCGTGIRISAWLSSWP